MFSINYDCDGGVEIMDYMDFVDWMVDMGRVMEEKLRIEEEVRYFVDEGGCDE